MRRSSLPSLVTNAPPRTALQPSYGQFEFMLTHRKDSIHPDPGDAVVALQASILSEAWKGAITLPTREEIADIPMPELPNLEPPSPRTQFETIAQYLQVGFPGSCWSLICPL